jgi:type IX secretion system substrate protein
VVFKSVLSVVFLLIILVNFADAQIATPYGNAIKHQMDSVLGFTFTSQNDSTLNLYIYRTFDNNDSLKSSIKYELIDNNWVKTNEYYYTYDQSGELMSQINKFNYDTNTRHMLYKNTYEYSNNKKHVKYVLYKWNGIDWVILSSMETEYRNNSTLQVLNKKSISYSNGEVNNVITDLFKYYSDSIYYYGGRTYYIMPSSDSTFIKYFQDEKGNTIRSSSYNWVGFWENEKVDEFELTYNTNDLLLEEINNYTYYNNISNEWVGPIPSYKTLYTYDSNGNLLSINSYNWNTSEWVINNTTVREYNSDNRRINTLIFGYYTGNLQFGFELKSIYNETGAVVETQQYNLIVSDSTWEGLSRYTFSYSNIYNTSYKKYDWSNTSIDWNPNPTNVTYKHFNVWTTDSINFIGCEGSVAYTDTIQHSSDTTTYLLKTPIFEITEIAILEDSLYLPAIPETLYSWINCVSGDTLQSNNDPYFVPKVSGTYYCSVSNENCYIDTDCLTFSILGLEPEMSIEIYPNPTQNILYIGSQSSRPYTLTLYSENGEIIITKSSKNINEELDISNLPNGIYLLHISYSTFSQVHKLIKD